MIALLLWFTIFAVITLILLAQRNKHLNRPRRSRAAIALFTLAVIVTGTRALTLGFATVRLLL